MGRKELARGMPKALIAVTLVLLIAATMAGATMAQARKKTVTRTFSSGPVNLPFTTFGGFTNTINIKKRGTIKDINIAVRITHPDTTNLKFLVHGKNYVGTPLSFNNPGDGPATPSPDFGSGPGGCDGNVFTVFDDEAPTNIVFGTNPFLGSYGPKEVLFPGGGKPPIPTNQPALRLFNGTDLKQRLTLESEAPFFEVPDEAGVLHCWQAIVRYKKTKGHRK